MLMAALFLLQVQEDDDPVVTDYVTCVVHQVGELYNASGTANAVARAAIQACKDKEPGLKASVRDDMISDMVKSGKTVDSAERAANKQIAAGWAAYMANLERNAEASVIRFRARLPQR